MIVIAALVAVTVLMTCGVAFGAPMRGSSAPDSGACGLDSHVSMGAVGVSVEAPKIAVERLHTALPVEVLFGVSQGITTRSVVLTAELPPPADPRHGRIRL